MLNIKTKEKRKEEVSFGGFFAGGFGGGDGPSERRIRQVWKIPGWG